MKKNNQEARAPLYFYLLYPDYLQLQVGGKRVTNLHSHRLAFGESQGWLS
ncbi:hypothetical protein VCHC33A2_0481 [Vibrio cholerae HC-33A2]|nr:hypothetical protein VCHC06A1_0494 [Vibrio cholerae HC-06A1]EHI03122.1 hypothetical protein VCHC33A2_0481 [Vibrio cholerae HC-33A2]EHI06778.1 hypothetical protein VCHC61A1_1301 [Vibrio cholerae HC-61A1]EJH48521.1 hypothetical protein VCCP104821_0427 [Vibrio cholerae CP1048(21)]ELT25978.1 hypothetical protein VCHC7A1_01500 [Vibrio cholerae HC-7A1]EMQ35205.1 hypothetical protein VCEM1546_000492 [Vibrio cholerae O1 str. EM-1546]EMQ49557.1 hypothetical protein VCPCS023_000412 [Vibrio cholerae 